jgi:hypothetical protein
VQEVVLLGKQPAGRTPLAQRWGERRLFFWTAFNMVKLVVAVTLAVDLIVCLMSGHYPAPQGLSLLK